MKFWGKLKREDRIQKSFVVNSRDIKSALDLLCHEFDLSMPVILEKHLNELSDFRRTCFYPEDFIDSVSFDVLEVEKISEKKKIK